MSKVNTVITSDYEGHPVIAGTFKEYKYSERHLRNNLELLESATTRHNKILTWRMDIRLPQSRDISKPPKEFIRSFMNSYTNKLARNGLDPDYVVKMEQETSEKPHFHIQVLVDGNKTKDYRPHVETAEVLLAEQLKLSAKEVDGLIDYCNKDRSGSQVRNGIMLRRGTPTYEERFDAVHKQMSYLAKQKDGDKIPSRERKVMYSRYNRKKCRNKD